MERMQKEQLIDNMLNVEVIEKKDIKATKLKKEKLATKE